MVSKLASLLLAAIVLASCGPNIERRALSEDDARRFVQSTIETGYKAGVDQAGLIVKARLRCDKSPTTEPSHCLLRAGDTMSIPDHHLSTTIKLTKIGPDTLEFQYNARFDHRAFGKNLLTETTGTFKVPANGQVPG